MKILLHRLCIILLSVTTSLLYAAQSYGKPDDPVVAEVLNMQIRTKNPEEMQAKKYSGVIHHAKEYWISGKGAEAKNPRWSIMHNVLGW